MHVERKGAEGLCSVDVCVDAALASNPAKFFARQSHTGCIGDICESQHSGFGRDCRMKGFHYLLNTVWRVLEANALHVETSPSSAHGPGNIVGRMILVKDYHFITRFQLQ